jgi:hypothetical protein
MARRPRQQQPIQAFIQIGKGHANPVVSNKKRKQPTDSLEVLPLNLKKQRVAVVASQQTSVRACKKAISQLSITAASTRPLGAKRKRDISPDSAIAVSPSASSPEPSEDVSQCRNELDSLERLCSAFLSALSLHYAHNPASSILDIRTLTPSVTKAWGVRKVILLDIRRLLGLMHAGPSSHQAAEIFRLKDYGLGKVCLELKRPSSKWNGPGHHLFDDTELRRKFKENLNDFWNTWNQNGQQTNPTNTNSFIDSLPLEPLITSSTTTKIAALSSKGQRRLEEVLTPFNKINLNDDTYDRPAKRTKANTDSPSILGKRSLSFPGTENVPPQSAADRSQSLLERIKAKESLAATLPAGPTKAERERQAALQRAQEFLQILNSLAVAKGGSRVSFTLPALTTNIQSSIRSPMAKEEILRCIKLLQTEITPGHISLVTFGSITGVVVDMNRKPSAGDVTAKLRSNGVQI